MKAGTNTSGKSPEDINSPKGRRRTVPPNTEYGQEERDGNRDNSSMNDSHTMSSFMTNVDKRWRTITKTVRLYFRSYKLVKFSEWFISVDQSFYWRRSLVWSQDDGVKLKTHITGKVRRSEREKDGRNAQEKDPYTAYHCKLTHEFYPLHSSLRSSHPLSSQSFPSP